MLIVVTALLFLLVLGIPIAASFSLIAIFNADSWNIDYFTIAAMPFDTISNYALLAIPLFILVGELMNRGGLVTELTAVADMLMSKIPAKMGHIMVAASGLMGAITGSSVATVAAIGGTVGVEMQRRGYPSGYAAALNASSGLLGVLIPPSIPLILYGAIVGVSITNLFIAAIVPGILFALTFSAIHIYFAKRVLPGGKEQDPKVEVSDFSDATPPGKLAIVRKAVPTLLLPVLTLGGIYGGILTVTEAAAVAGLYALLIILFRKEISFEGLRKVLVNAVLVSAAIMAIIAFTSIFNRALILEQVPQLLAASISEATENPLLFLLLVNIILIPIGMVMETNAATMLMGPLLAPVALMYNIDPVHFGIILVTNIEVGLLTPPMAANLYVAQKANSARLTEMLRYTWPFLGGSLLMLMLITYVPALTEWYKYL